MVEKEHINYLNELKEDYWKGWLVFPKKEGAFYFGEDMTYDEYVDRYEKECFKRGYIYDA